MSDKQLSNAVEKKLLDKDESVFFATENAKVALARSQKERINGFSKIRLLRYAQENIEKALKFLGEV
jgi:hypothetical protein